MGGHSEYQKSIIGITKGRRQGQGRGEKTGARKKHTDGREDVEKKHTCTIFNAGPVRSGRWKCSLTTLTFTYVRTTTLIHYTYILLRETNMSEPTTQA